MNFLWLDFLSKYTIFAKILINTFSVHCCVHFELVVGNETGSIYTSFVCRDVEFL